MQKDVENDEGFYTEAMSTFLKNILSLSDAHRKEQKIPSNFWMKHVNACWLRRIKDLKEMINKTDV
jgi:hypothetical protein